MTEQLLIQKPPTRSCAKAGWITFAIALALSVATLGTLGWILFAVAFILGVGAMVQDNLGHGIALVCVNLIAGSVSFFLFIAVAFTQTQQ